MHQITFCIKKHIREKHVMWFKRLGLKRLLNKKLYILHRYMKGFIKTCEKSFRKVSLANCM